jgi:hypothetical protein
MFVVQLTVESTIVRFVLSLGFTESKRMIEEVDECYVEESILVSLSCIIIQICMLGSARYCYVSLVLRQSVCRAVHDGDRANTDMQKRPC